MEDPIEFLHKDKRCYVNQREIGNDTQDFASALKRALRQDPDVILVGEMRDLESIALAVTAAETGHLVFGTLHTTSAAKSVDRIVGVFPPTADARANAARGHAAGNHLADAPPEDRRRANGGARDPDRDGRHSRLIRENKMAQIPVAMQTGKKYGMQMLEDAHERAPSQKLIKPEDAIAKANNARDDQEARRAGGAAARRRALRQPGRDEVRKRESEPGSSRGLPGAPESSARRWLRWGERLPFQDCLITYQDLCDEAGVPFSLPRGHQRKPVGNRGVLRGERLASLNALVVNARTHEPHKSYDTRRAAASRLARRSAACLDFLYYPDLVKA